MSVFKINGACFAYKDKMVFKDLNFDLNPGEILAILGHNGVGKTTLIKCCIGLLKWTNGKSFLLQKDIKSIPIKKLFSQIAYVPQAKNSSINLSVLDMVLLGCNMHIKSIPKKMHREKAYAILESLNIAKLSEKSCANLSGGELQMVVLARALINDPLLIILDEPESNLDFKNQHCILNVLENLKKQNKAIIINTHFPQNAYKLADKVLIMQDRKYLFGDKHLINKKQLSTSFEVDENFFDYLNLL
ncbi:ABC transporter ATP-binding protein [Helicobacter sp.]|uniref:ABC transporter ATP-binding protein n=1 Tax=Helicobacter sp. TaxID=218 RepID=UPI0025BD5D17|nr:ABC transporter ATP-binding protein [Helicobacter sp.]MCI5968297.1 ABC transporter ATP-binding protein [Helicobacter sp.]MDY2585389.1 ABC transporter ATP-binding protein [Helicobacter sp.]